MKFLIAFVILSASVLSQVSFANHPHHPHHPHPSQRLSTWELGFGFTGPGCFLRAPAHFLPSHTWHVLNSGGVPVQTTQGLRIMTSFDPLHLNPYLFRQMRNDMIVSTPNGYAIFNRYGFIPYGFVEVFQTPLDAGLCY